MYAFLFYFKGVRVVFKKKKICNPFFAQRDVLLYMYMCQHTQNYIILFSTIQFISYF